MYKKDISSNNSSVLELGQTDYMSSRIISVVHLNRRITINFRSDDLFAHVDAQSCYQTNILYESLKDIGGIFLVCFFPKNSHS